MPNGQWPGRVRWVRLRRTVTYQQHGLSVRVGQIKIQNRRQTMEQPKILVAIRKRPLSKKQLSKGETDQVSVKTNDTVIVSEYKQKVDLTKYMEETIFNFDFAFHEDNCNEEIYDMAVRPLVNSAFQGARVTCFAYGQTGSGKTFTMNGVMQQGIPGLYTLGANDIFEYLAAPQYRHLKAKLSFYEIYCGKLYDLLNKRTELKLREDNKNNINIIGLEEAPVSCSEEFIEYLTQGGKERITSQNSANAESSRSHAILQISLKEGKKTFGKISFIDLAGNERGADHMDMNKQTRIDGAEINKSLLSLKECIRALDQGKGHTPFRGSKLTMVLKDSFVGFCRTVMIGNVSPSSASSENTLNTLRYADRVKQLRKPQEVSGSKEEQRARELMLPRQNKNAIKIMISNDDDADDIAGKRDEARKEYGIGEELSKKIGKEDLGLRKNSFNTKLQGSINKQESKSSSLSKNRLANSLGNKASLANNLVTPHQAYQPQPRGQPNPSHANPSRGMQGDYESNQYDEYEGQYREVPQGMNRYNSLQCGAVSKKQEPMEIETPQPYYMPTNNKNQGGVGRGLGGGSNNQAGRNQQQQGYNMAGQSQNTLGNCSNLSMNSHMSHSQGPYQQGQAQMQGQWQGKGPYQQGQAQMQGQWQGQGPYQQGQGQGRNTLNNYSNKPNQNKQQPQKAPNNYVQNNLIQQPRQQRQTYQLPQNWEDMSSLVSSSNDPAFTEHVVSQMNQRLFTEEEELVRNHSDSLRREIDIIKSQMRQLNEIEIDRSKITSRGYVHFMQDSIEEKISMLEELRENMINFTYKLDAVEEIESKSGMRSGQLELDEQLLDDIN